jgi:hypothetical protein
LNYKNRNHASIVVDSKTKQKTKDSFSQKKKKQVEGTQEQHCFAILMYSVTQE